MKKSILALLLVISMFACACSSSSTDVQRPPKDTVGDSTTAPSSPENPFESIYRERDDKVPELDLDGRVVRTISMESNGDTGPLYEDEICVEDLMSEPLNDAIYNRTLYVEDRLNCDIINEFGAGESWKIGDKLNVMFNSGDDTYQIISFQAARTMNMALDGYLYDLRNIEGGYIEFDAPWWEMQYIEELAMENETYALAGALSLSLLRSVHATFFNKNIAEDYKLEDLYQVVWDGRWTIDYQAELASTIYKDLNGNSIADAEDRFGFGTPGYWATDSYWCAFDLDVLSRNNEGKFEITIDKDKLHSALDKIYHLCYLNTGSYRSVADASATEFEKVFSSDQVLFMTNKLCVAETTNLRNMSSDYGIIPMPKYDENQKNYGSMPFELFSMFSIPTTAQNPDELTAVLELMCAESWRKVIPTYSDLVLKGKYMSDPESQKMFDLIVDSIRVEAGLIYCYQIDEISTFLMRYSIDWDDFEHFSSVYATKIRKANIGLRFLNEKIG